ncbi:DNA-directed RNA polymerase [Musa troglodytarum]|uniref:DNA-directed RNA polymerase n=1 Tax=Musa troglodytarum TaxID=320322 RepID=A0A9E7KIC0_9LILI|nr:DNA-directed RNA polymerase [Musa troglodytarum]URE17435.1 DNA-directed RNA polymerase [Musa troglodytarum]
MTDAEAASGVVDSVHFSFYTSEEIRKISVKKITKPNLLDAKNSPVKRYVAQLDLIVKGDINGARCLEANSWGEVFFPEEETVESVAPSNFDKAKHFTWTSLQQSEALSVLSKFMRERRKKCDNCGKRNPTIHSPVFGWLNKTTQESDI